MGRRSKTLQGVRVAPQRFRRGRQRATLLVRLGLWLTAFALLSQSLAILLGAANGFRRRPFGSPPNSPRCSAPASSSARRATAAAPPTEAPPTAATPCPLCQVAANAAALDLPAAAALAAPARAPLAKLVFTPQTQKIPQPRARFLAARRAPPSLT